MARSILFLTIGNLVAAASVFLPMLVLGMMVTSLSRGYSFAQLLTHWMGDAVLLYIGLIPSSVVGVVGYSALLALFMRGRLRIRQIAAVAIAPAVPLVPTALKIDGAWLFGDSVVETAVATALFGLAVAAIRTWWPEGVSRLSPR